MKRIGYVKGSTFKFNLEVELEKGFWNLYVLNVILFGLQKQLVRLISTTEFCDVMLTMSFTTQRRSAYRICRSLRPHICKPQLKVPVALMQTSRQRKSEVPLSLFQNRQITKNPSVKFQMECHSFHSIRITITLHSIGLKLLVVSVLFDRTGHCTEREWLPVRSHFLQCRTGDRYLLRR